MAVTLNELITSVNRSPNIQIERFCKIKKYLTVKEKIDFIKEYKALVAEHANDFGSEFSSFVGLIFFNTLAISKYTNIELDQTYDSFDLLQQNDLIEKIVRVIGSDYELLLNMVKQA